LLREMGEPTGALADLVDDLVRPRFETLRAAVEVLAPWADRREVVWATLAVFGQIAYHRTAGPIALALLGERAYGPSLVAELVESLGFEEGTLVTPATVAAVVDGTRRDLLLAQAARAVERAASSAARARAAIGRSTAQETAAQAGLADAEGMLARREAARAK